MYTLIVVTMAMQVVHIRTVYSVSYSCMELRQISKFSRYNYNYYGIIIIILVSNGPPGTITYRIMIASTLYFVLYITLNFAR